MVVVIQRQSITVIHLLLVISGIYIDDVSFTEVLSTWFLMT